MQSTEDDIAVRKLQKYIASLNFEDDNLVKTHKNIYTYVEKKITRPGSAVSDRVPPVDVLVYTAKNILFPTFAQELTAHLLDIIATVEVYRRQAVEKAEKILNQYGTEGGEPTIVLTDGEKTYLKQQLTSDQSWRGVYMTILSNCCHYNLYHLWIAEPSSMGAFMTHFNEYFPFLNKYCTHPSPRLFHQSLTQDELKVLGSTGLAICEFSSNSARWIADNTVNDQPYWTLFQTEEFRRTFTPPCSSGRLIKLICNYLDYVAVMVRKVDDACS